MSCYIKSLEWICDGKAILKIESINAYLQDVTANDEITILSGKLRILIVEKSDIQIDIEQKIVTLLENTDYWITYDINNTNIDTVALTDIISKQIEGRGIVNSRNYVGILDIGIEDFEIVIKSKKVNYEHDYFFLKKCISEFCDDLLNRSSSHFAEHFEKTDEYVEEKINYSEVAYIKDNLSPDKLPNWIDYLICHAEHKYLREEEKRNIVDVEDIDADAYMNALIGDNLISTNKIKGRAGKLNRVPLKIKSHGYEIIYDTNENRFVKFFVCFLRDYLEEIYLYVSEENAKLRREVDKMLQIFSEKLENPFWKGISQMDTIPFNSQILQKKYPYNMIFQMYTDFSMKSKVSLGEVEQSYLVGQKDTPMLYQYWVFIMLFQFLSKKYDDKYMASDWIFYNKNRLTFSLREGRKSIACFQIDENTQINLLYNKTYDRKHSIGDGRSYSHELKPDISIELFKNNDLVAIMHLDAKYKVSVNGAEIPDDINKMHAYKDGILGTVGAFAICLTDEPIIFHEEEKGWEKEGVYPAVGTCPLNLNPDKIDEELEYIYGLVDEFIRIDEDNLANRYSRRCVEKYFALSRRLMKVKE